MTRLDWFFVSVMVLCLGVFAWMVGALLWGVPQGLPGVLS